MSKVIQSKTTVDQQFPFLAPTAYLEKIDWQNPDDPLKKMVWPDEKETEVKSYQIKDPIGDEAHLGVPNLVHRYPDRVLLLLTNRCQINCRFCFRRELTHHSQPPDLEAVYNYLTKHLEVKEVIFSGGDPLALSAKYLTQVYTKLSSLSQLKIFRFHTRIPVVNPEWLTTNYLELFAKIATNHQLVLVLHINHLREMSDHLTRLCRELTRAGALLLSQTVLLKGVNDRPQTLAELFNNLTYTGIKPYYLHHPDFVSGTHHFRVSVAEGLAIYRQVRNQVSGISIPTYVLDLPGGRGKVPVESLLKVNDREYQALNFKGETVTYLDPAD